jgi:hypothetical protein
LPCRIKATLREYCESLYIGKRGFNANSANGMGVTEIEQPGVNDIICKFACGQRRTTSSTAPLRRK